MDFSAAERARRIRLILFDVEGVLTDGKIWVFPIAERNFEAKDFHAQDCVGVSLASVVSNAESSPSAPQKPKRCGPARWARKWAGRRRASPAGRGAGRDAVDFILQAHGILDQCIEEYLDERNATAATVEQGV
jgi:3-deoxy-D-manno-octulosonate 8-phosphate phosphatase KdsC-like HAD superfamily phosphatase